MSTITIPNTAAELEATLNDKGKLKAIGENGQFGDYARAYAKATHEKDADLAEQIQNGLAQGWTAFMKAQKEDGATPINLGKSPEAKKSMLGDKQGLFNQNAPGAKIDNEYDSASEYFRSVYHNVDYLKNGAALKAKADKVQSIQNSFGSTVPGDGGFLIPETLRSELLQVALESAVVRPRAKVVPMESLRVPFPMIDATTNAGSVYGGIVGYWTEEGAAAVESQATFGRVALEAKRLAAYAEVPNELIQDATAFGAFIGDSFPKAIAYFEDIAFLKGSGVGEPLGALTAGNTALVSVAKETGQSGGTIVWENIIKMYARMLPQSLANAVWIVTPDAFPELATMALSIGTGGSAVWLNNGVDGPPARILGRPVIITEKAPGLLGTQGDISFVDLSMYLIGDRQIMQVESSPHFKFSSNKTSYLVQERVDGRPWIQAAITPQNGGPTMSPFVQLATRS